jgi:PleD family two-component response regulator
MRPLRKMVFQMFHLKNKKLQNTQTWHGNRMMRSVEERASLEPRMSVSLRILVVEDEHILADNVKSYLARRSHDVRIGGDGRRAMEMVESFTPYVVVLVYGLPSGNGLQV